MSDPILHFIHISDTHINPDLDYTQPYAQYTPMIGAKALVKAINELPIVPDFVLHTGDVAYDPDPQVFNTVRELMEEINYPVLYVAGNHDDRRYLQLVLLEREIDHLQDNPYWEMDINGVQIIGIDSNGDAKPPSGMIPLEQLEWLNRICTDENDTRPLVIAVHHNILPTNTPWLDDWMRTQNGEDFHAVVRNARDRLRGVFHGHIHQQTTTFRDGILYSSVGSSWCQFFSITTPENTDVQADPITKPSFNLVTITKEQTYIRPYFFDVPQDKE